MPGGKNWGSEKSHIIFDRSPSAWDTPIWNPITDGLSSISTRQDRHDSCWWRIHLRTRDVLEPTTRQCHESLIEKVQTSLCPYDFYPFWQTGHFSLKTVADIRPTSCMVVCPWSLTWVSIWGRCRISIIQKGWLQTISHQDPKKIISWQSARSCGQQQRSLRSLGPKKNWRPNPHP